MGQTGRCLNRLRCALLLVRMVWSLSLVVYYILYMYRGRYTHIMRIHIYIYICIHTYMHAYIYIYIIFVYHNHPASKGFERWGLQPLKGAGKDDAHYCITYVCIQCIYIYTHTRSILISITTLLCYTCIYIYIYT